MAKQLISPFDPAAQERLRRMGLLTKEDRIHAGVLEAAAVVHAGLLFDQIHDVCGDWDGTFAVCRRLIEQAALVSERQVLLLISIQYDAMAKPLPEVIWWISGSDLLLPPFIRCFVQHLDDLCSNMGGDAVG